MNGLIFFRSGTPAVTYFSSVIVEMISPKKKSRDPHYPQSFQVDTQDLADTLLLIGAVL